MSTPEDLQRMITDACLRTHLLADAAKIASARSAEGEDVSKTREAWETIDHLRTHVLSTLSTCAVELSKIPQPKAPRSRKR